MKQKIAAKWGAWRRARVALGMGLVAGSLGLFAGCSGDEDTGAGVGGECTTSKDCKRDLVCRSAQCVEVRTGDDAGGRTTSDATDSPDGSANNGPGPITAADYFVSYMLIDNLNETRALYVMSTADGSEVQLSDAEHPCEYGCWLSYDMTRFLWLKPAASGAVGAVDLHSANVQDRVLQGAGSVIAQGITGMRLLQKGVTYSRGGSAYYLAFQGGASEVKLAEVGGAGLDTGWFVDPEHDLLMLYAPTLATLALSVGGMSGGVTPVFTIDANGWAEGTGSFYDSLMPVAASRDGKIIAFRTIAPNSYGTCQTAADCSGPVKFCGQSGQCMPIELTVNFLDTTALDKLGKPCASDDSCGAIHECDRAEAGAGEGQCIPRRVVLGLPDRPAQSADQNSAPKSGCQLSAGNSDYKYTALDESMGFDSAGNLYGVAHRKCTSESPVGISDIIKINPKNGAIEVVWGNGDGGFDPDLCWDPVNLKPDGSRCKPYIHEALLSPDGNDLAVSATNPWVDDERQAADSLDLWRVRRNGQQQGWIGKHSRFHTIDRIAVHTAP